MPPSRSQLIHRVAIYPAAQAKFPRETGREKSHPHDGNKSPPSDSVGNLECGFQVSWLDQREHPSVWLKPSQQRLRRRDAR